MFRTKFYLFIFLFSAHTIQAQTCNNCGEGSMGNFHATTNQTIIGGDYDFKSFKIDYGVELTVIGTQPLLIRSKESVIINGKIIASGSSGNDASNVQSVIAIGIAGSGNGGQSMLNANIGQEGTGIGKGKGGDQFQGGGGAGFSSNGNINQQWMTNGGILYGDSILSKKLGGSGGGAGWSRNNIFSAGGGAGGGAISIYSCEEIRIGQQGAIICNGGNGGNSSTIDANGAGGGSGGSIHLSAATITNEGLISVAGGNGGINTILNQNNYKGGDGSNGRLKLDAIKINNEGQIFPYSYHSEKPLVANAWRILDPSCYGTANGFIKIRSNGGQQPHRYNWSNGVTTSHNDHLLAGTYTYTVTDRNGCKQTDKVTLENPLPIEPIIYTTTPNCPNESNANIFAGAVGGTPWPYNKNLTTTLYGTTSTPGIMFEIGLKSTARLNKISLVIENNTVNNIEIFYKSGSFSGYENNIASWQSLGNYQVLGQGKYQESTIKLTNPIMLGEGNYSLYIYNHNGKMSCIESSTLGSLYVFDHVLSIYDGKQRPNSVANPFTAAIGQAATFCGKINYTLVNNNNLNYTIDIGQNNVQLQNNLGKGIYPIAVTDAMGCSVIDYVQLKDPEPFEIKKEIKQPTCNNISNGSIMIQTQDNNIQKHISSQNAWNTSASNIYFDIEVKEDLNLEGFDMILQDSAEIDIYIKSNSYIGHETDQTKWIKFTSYSSTNLIQNFPEHIIFPTPLNNLIGKYGFYIHAKKGTIKAIKNNHTSSNNHIEILAGISNNSTTAFDTITAKSSSYFGNILYKRNNNNFNYLWNTGSTLSAIGQVSAGNYMLTVTDDNGCKITDTIKVTSPSTMNLQFTSNNEIDDLKNGSIQISVSGGTPPYYYYWFHNASNNQTQEGLPAGTYPVLIVDKNGCNYNQTIEVTRTITPPLSKGELNLMPVPTKGKFSIAKPIKGMDSGVLKMYDSIGRMIYSATHSVEYLMTQGMDIEDLSDGVYYLTLQDEDQMFNGKIILTR